MLGPKPKPILWKREGGCIRCTSHTSDQNGYPLLTRFGRQWRIARWILWRRFKGRIPPGIVARHTCDNSWCINPRHIISGTIAQNNQDKLDRGRHRLGERAAHAKLTEQAVRAIRSRPDDSQRKLAKEFGVTESGIWRIRHRHTWRHVQ